MNIKQAFAIALFLFSFVSCSKDDAEPTNEIKTNNPLITELDNRVNEIITPYAKGYSFASLSIGIFKDNQISYYGYGETKKGNNAIPNSETLYEIGSITKTFTALLTIDFLQSKNLTLDAPINNFLPSTIPTLQFNGNSIKIKHLLNHTSGLPRLPADFENGMNQYNPYKHYDSTKVYNYLKTFTLPIEPGTTWDYSNLGAGLAGLILERQNHKSFEQLLLEKICAPLGLNSTKISITDEDKLNLAVGYNRWGMETSYWNDMAAFKGAGAIISNAKDMISYGKAILDYQSTSLNNQIASCLNVTFEDSNIKMASGWIKQIDGDNEYFLHDGGTGGFSSFIFICKPKNVVLIILFSNETSNSIGSTIGPLIEEVLK